ncbi:MAG: MBL fold metallo-hydrolase [Gammaproteobacteria bacterium]|nr:MBL fold metallo-hydrolase [Gammaproteobacteria bacterium]
MKITFLGGTETVTGSKYLLSFEDNKTVLIDCGLFQGYKELRLRNWNPLPFDPKNLSAVVLTHAHIDHSGYLPLLVKNGFNGPIYSSKGTKELCEILLPDSAHIQEEDAKQANKYGYSKHKPALPLYTISDAEKALKLFKPIAYGTKTTLFDNTYFQLIRSGHIIGSSFVKLNHQDKSILFSGDIGRMKDPVMNTPTFIQQTDYLVLESTYGDRNHEKEHPKILLKNIINQTLSRGGSIIIPAFAVGRTQSILHYLAELRSENEIPNIPIFLDSPMAINATKVLCRNRGDHHLNETQCRELCEAATYINTFQESMALDMQKSPKIIISASGMATGGRVLFHLKAYAVDARNTILFAGFQAGGTRGAAMLKGATEIKIHGQRIPLRAHVEVVGNTSAHADSEEILTWLKHFDAPPKKTFITHGEPKASLALQNKIETVLGWNCMVPHYEQTELLV